jgi:hypothetical protein
MIIIGGKAPFLLRPQGDHYNFVGQCYVHEMMDGEALAEIESGRLKEEWFALR